MKNEASDVDKAPDPVDIYVGKRIRDRRKEVRFSQERLAEHLRLTFQQVQKYEKGANRVSASKLYEIARALHCPIEYFFRGLASTVLANEAVAQSQQPFVHDFINSDEGQELAREFPKIHNPKVRQRVLELVKSLAEENRS